MSNQLGILRFIKERFPLQILVFTTLSSVLASSAMVTEGIDYWKVIVAFVITTFFLFHIRAIDERRDFISDSKLHPNRPVQQGVISIKSLLIVSITGIVLSLALALHTSLATFIIALMFVAFTIFAAFDFFMPSYFKDKPVLYHIVNSPQMVLLQWLIFSVFTSGFAITKNMLLFMLLIYNNIFILELVRKVKVPGQDTEDSYSSHLGLRNSVFFLITLVLAGYTIYALICSEISTNLAYSLVYGGLLSICLIGEFLYFYYKPQVGFQKIMELSAVVFYVVMNVLIFIVK